jgi:hypothetical protein
MPLPLRQQVTHKIMVIGATLTIVRRAVLPPAKLQQKTFKPL